MAGRQRWRVHNGMGGGGAGCRGDGREVGGAGVRQAYNTRDRYPVVAIANTQEWMSPTTKHNQTDVHLRLPSVFGLRSSVFGRRYSVFGLKSSVFGIRS